MTDSITFRCCTPDQAWSWVRCVAELALTGDSRAQQMLAATIEHALQAERPTAEDIPR